MPNTRQNSHSEESDQLNLAEGKRQRESPIEDGKNPKKASKKQPTRNMGENNVTLSADQWREISSKLDKISAISILLEPLNESVETIKAKIDQLNDNISRIDSNLKKVNENQTKTDQRLSKLENAFDKLSEKLEVFEREKNKLEQKMLNKQFVIFGLPAFDKRKYDDVIKALSEKSRVRFDKSDLKNFYALTQRSDHTKCVVHGEFHSEKIIASFLAGCKANKPLIAEDIVELERGDQRRGTEIYVKPQLTHLNQELSLEARNQRIKGKFKYTWVKDGRILVKADDNAATVEITSMKQLMAIVTGVPRTRVADDTTSN